MTSTPKVAANDSKVRLSKWDIEVACAELSLGRLPDAWRHPWGGLAGVHVVTGKENVMVVTTDLLTAYELNCQWAEYSFAAVCWWDEAVPPPNLCRVLNMRVISDSKYVPAHLYVEDRNVLFDRDWMAKACGELFQRMGDPTGEGLMALTKRRDPRARYAAKRMIERIKQVARILGVPYCEGLWYKRTMKAIKVVGVGHCGRSDQR